MTPSHIPYLRELTAKLTAAPTTQAHNLGGGLRSEIAGLLKNDKVAVAHFRIDAGGKFPVHRHGQREVIVVYHGEIILTTMERSQTLSAGDVIIFEPDESHKAEAITESWLVAITIPADEGYPNV